MDTYQMVGVGFSVIFLVGLVGSVIYFTRASTPEEKILFMFMMVISTMLSVFVIDNIIAFKVQLLSPKEDETILQAMTDIIKITLGAIVGAKYFGEKKLL